MTLSMTAAGPWARGIRRGVLGCLLASACSPSQTGSARAQLASMHVAFMHAGFGAGPVLFTDDAGHLVEERRQEPFGASIDAHLHTGQGDTVGAPDLAARDLTSLNKRVDVATGWSDHGARWSSPETGRWLSGDPPVAGPRAVFMSAPWRLNPYQFVDDNPIVYWDPDGQQPAATTPAEQLPTCSIRQGCIQISPYAEYFQTDAKRMVLYAIDFNRELVRNEYPLGAEFSIDDTSRSPGGNTESIPLYDHHMLTIIARTEPPPPPSPPSHWYEPGRLTGWKGFKDRYLTADRPPDMTDALRAGEPEQTTLSRLTQEAYEAPLAPLPVRPRAPHRPSPTLATEANTPASWPADRPHYLMPNDTAGTGGELQDSNPLDPEHRGDLQ